MTRAQERRNADLAAHNKDRLLDGLKQTGRVLDNAKSYQGQREELRGIQGRIDRIERGIEKP